MVSCSQISKLCIIYLHLPFFNFILFCSNLAVQQMKLLGYLKWIPLPTLPFYIYINIYIYIWKQIASSSAHTISLSFILILAPAMSTSDVYYDGVN